MNYKGVHCPVCEKELKQGEDIVVCPECGMPHHRACYKELGHCARTDLHAKGEAWENPNPSELAVPRTTTDKICPNCGTHNPPAAQQCGKCHTSLTQSEKGSVLPSIFGEQERGNLPLESGGDLQDMMGDMLGSIHENDLIGDLPAKDFIFYVRNNYFYFLRIFKMMCQRTKARIFNWSAFFFHFFYFFYRKMYKIGFVVLAIMLFTLIPNVILYSSVMQQLAADPAMLQQSLNDPNVLLTLVSSLKGFDSLSLASEILMYIRIAVCIFCGFTANRRYYQQVVSQISKTREEMHTSTGNDYYYALTAKGGASLRAILLLIVGIVAVTLSGSYFLAASLLL